MGVYTPEKAAEFLGIEPATLERYTRLGRINTDVTRKRLRFTEDELMQYFLLRVIQAEERQERNFDMIYGKGEYVRLLNLLADPMLNNQEIAVQYGVTRERISKRRRLLYPEASNYHERRHLSAIEARKQKLLENEFFCKFYRITSSYLLRDSIELIPAKDGFRKHAVKMNGRKVLLRKAPRARNLEIRYRSKHPMYQITNPLDWYDYVFYFLGTTDDFLFVPQGELPSMTIFTDSETSMYWKFKNNFNVLPQRRRGRRAT